MMQRVRGGRKLSYDYNKFFTEVLRNGVRRSILQLRGRSEAAALPCKTPEPRKRKRVPLEDRRAMIESYVARYRSANAGKFPSVSAVQKEVGGSYYVSRKIVQELEYSLKVRSPSIENERASSQGVVEDEKLMTNDEVAATVSETKEVFDTVIVEDIQMSDISDKQVKDAGGPRDEGIAGDEKVMTENEMASTVSETKDVLHSVIVENIQMSDIRDKQVKYVGGSRVEGIVEDEKLMTDDEVALTVSETKDVLHSVIFENIQMSDIRDKQAKDAGGSQVEGIVEDEKLITDDEVALTVSETKEDLNTVIVKDIQMNEISNKLVEDAGGLQAEGVVEDKKLMTEDEVASIVSETKEELHTAIVEDIQMNEIGDKQVEDAGRSQADTRSENMLLDGVLDLKTSIRRDDLDATSGKLPTTCSPQEEKHAIEPSSDAEHTRKSSLWGNLRSFADDILNFWRKL